METSKKPPSSFIGLATVQLPYFNSLPIGIIHSLLQSFCVELEKQVRTSSFQRAENQEVFPVPFLVVITNSICHSTPKISVQYLQKWTVIPVFSLSWHCSNPSFLHGYSTLCASLPIILSLFFPAIHWSGNQAVSCCPVNPGPDSISTSLSARCHPAKCSSHTPTAVKCWRKAGQPKHSYVFGFCHLFWCFPLSLYPSWGMDLPRTWLHGHIPNRPYPTFTLPLASEYPAIYR